jgi:hypothetical protein
MIATARHGAKTVAAVPRSPKRIARGAILQPPTNEEGLPGTADGGMPPAETRTFRQGLSIN